MQEKTFALPRDIAELQLGSVDLLMAMYPDAVEAPLATKEYLNDLRLCLDAELPLTSSSISLTIQLAVDDSHSIPLHVCIPFESYELKPLEPPPITYGLRQPPWLSKADLARLAASVPKDDIYEAFECILASAPQFLQPQSTATAFTPQIPDVRVWFYFPSLSTREKRDDLVNQAPRYHLTGFVLAGKPGFLCLEGQSQDVDAYMKFIKTESWGDIPSYQKKVSERFREEGVERKFDGMTEMTDEWERTGQRSNRSDMKALEGWLTERGLGEAFQKVIF